MTIGTFVYCVCGERHARAVETSLRFLKRVSRADIVVVTGVYKNPGDCVGAGEPVIRVEDNTTIFLLGTFVYRGAIKVGSTVSVTTNLFDAGGAPTSVSGSVVALRSRGDDDQWDVVVQCTNPLDGSGAPTFPSGYVFDYDNTTVTVT